MALFLCLGLEEIFLKKVLATPREGLGHSFNVACYELDPRRCGGKRPSRKRARLVYLEARGLRCTLVKFAAGPENSTLNSEGTRQNRVPLGNEGVGYDRCN